MTKVSIKMGTNNLLKKCITLLFAVIFCNGRLQAQNHQLTIHNKTENDVSFVRYDEWGNYEYFPVESGKTKIIRFDNDYMNIFPLEDGKDIPYFFFPNDEVYVTSVKDNIYSFESADQERGLELLLSAKIFLSIKQGTALIDKSGDLTTTINKTIDAAIASLESQAISPQFKNLVRLFYFYKLLGENIKYNALQNTLRPFEQFWKNSFNTALQSYILSFRTYALSYLPKFIEKKNLLNAYDSMFHNLNKEIAMYTVMHMAYYKDRPWFLENYDAYRQLSKDRQFYEKLAYFKLTDDLVKNPDDILLIGASKDTLSLNTLLSKLKGKVILIDLWASWCQPCISQMPFSNELSKTFDKKEFEVLYLSLDREFHLFTRFSTKNMQGKLNYNIVGNFDSPFAKLNKISGIPRYMIINKQGIIVNNRAPFPSDSSLKKMIQEYL